MKAYAHTNYVINSIKSTLLDLVLKLQEVDETIDPIDTSGSVEFQLEDLLSGNISNDLLLRVIWNEHTQSNSNNNNILFLDIRRQIA